MKKLLSFKVAHIRRPESVRCQAPILTPCRAFLSAGAIRFFSVEWKRQFPFLRILGFSSSNVSVVEVKRFSTKRKNSFCRVRHITRPWSVLCQAPIFLFLKRLVSGRSRSPPRGPETKEEAMVSCSIRSITSMRYIRRRDRASLPVMARASPGPSTQRPPRFGFRVGR